MRLATLFVLFALGCGSSASAAFIISEVHPSGSGNASYGVDWFELTNTGTTDLNITGWKIDDNSSAIGTAASLVGVTNIPAGASVIFLESATPDTTIPLFLAAWFGNNVPAGLAVGSYSGSGLGLSTAGDAVTIFDADSVIAAKVSFGAATTGVTFDNAAGLNNATISQLSVVGVNGAFLSNNGLETGSPGRIAAMPAIPEPASMVLTALGVVGLGAFNIARNRSRARV